MADPNQPEDITRKAPQRAAREPVKHAATGEWVPTDSSGVRLAVPPRIGRFEVKAVLGTGSYGRVFLAFDPEMGRQVAIKQPFGEGLKPEYRDDFLKEARAAAVIDQHANVCPVYHIDTDGGLPYIVMRFVPGGTLKNYLDRHGTALPPRTALLIANKIALGLTAAHTKGIIHRDLKPANVLVDEANDEFLITDFGLARIATRAQAAASLQRGAHGTPYYMPPEQWGSQMFGPITPLADVYSLGVILYEMLAGQVPFTGAPFELMTRHCAERPRPLSSVRPGVDPRLDALCLKALEKTPANRYRSAKEFADVLMDYMRAADTEQGKATPKPILPTWLKDHMPSADTEQPEALPLGEPIEESLPRPGPTPPVWGKPPAPPPQPLKRPGASLPSASTASLPEATLDEKEIVRCPKCNARLEIATNRTRPIDCPMCALKFAVEAGRQAATRAAAAKEKERPVPIAPPERSRERRDTRSGERRLRREDEDEIPRRHWQPTARGFRLVWIGLLVIAVFAFGLTVTAIASLADDSSKSDRYSPTNTYSGKSSSTYSGKSSTTKGSSTDSEKSSKGGSPSDAAKMDKAAEPVGSSDSYSTASPSMRKDSDDTIFHVGYVLLGFGIAVGLGVVSLGRILAARLPAGVPGGTAAILSGAAGWGAVVCLVVASALIGWLMDEPHESSSSRDTTLPRFAAILVGAALLLLLAAEFAFNRYLIALRRYIPGFPRTLTRVAGGFLWFLLAFVVIGGLAALVLGTIDEVKYKQAVTFSAIVTGGATCLTMILLPFWGFVTLWLNVHSAIVLHRHAFPEQ